MEQKNMIGIAGQDANWQAKVMQDVMLEAIIEQRRSRRWKIFFSAIMVSYYCSGYLLFI